MYCTRRINDDYTWVGADGRRLAMFEGVFDVPAGISFNSYLLRDEKTVLFDTTDAAVRRTFRENLLHALEGRSLDCVVVHHMEPDHTAELEELVLRFPEVQIYCSAMAKTMMTQFFGPGFQERIHVVKEGDTLCTGRHTLRFIAAPMVHWPEVLMTYDETDRLLLTADAFGCFGALNGRLFADEVDFDRDYLDETRRYYTNIVGKYGSQVQAVLKKVAELDIAMLLPLHGFVWRKELAYLLHKYDLWSRYEPEERGVLIAYASVYGNTENAANILACRLSERGVKCADVRYLRDAYLLHSVGGLPLQPSGVCCHYLQRRGVHHHGGAAPRYRCPRSPESPGGAAGERLLGPGQRQGDAEDPPASEGVAADGGHLYHPFRPAGGSDHAAGAAGGHAGGGRTGCGPGGGKARGAAPLCVQGLRLCIRGGLPAGGL